MMPKKLVMLLWVTLFELAGLGLRFSQAVDVHRLRELAGKHNVTSILVFGDSSVDPGNNNFIQTDMKGNYVPYGQNFFGGAATGRFCDGRLATDFIAEALGYSKTIQAFLDRRLNRTDLLNGVSFASSGSGYDDLTANLSSVLSFSKQLNYFRHYKIHLTKLVGPLEAQEKISNAIYILSMGSNDFLQNYFVEDIRPKQFSLEQYLNFLASNMYNDAKMLGREGCKRLVIVGVPPLGCMPLIKTLRGQTTCVQELNKLAFSFNSKIKQKLQILRTNFRIKSAFVDDFAIIEDAIQNPKTYGLSETSNGCCGTGTYEYGDTCKGLSTCEDASKYVFWDAVHPTQKMYQIIAQKAIESINLNIFD